MYVSLLNLLGLPNLRGFFSKDLVIEIINYTMFSFILNLLMFLNVFFTYYYTYQLFYYSFQSNKLNPYQLFHSPMLLHCCLLVFLSMCSLIFGFYFLYNRFNFILFTSVPLLNKLLPIYLNLFTFFVLFINSKLFTSHNKFLNFYFSNIMFLSTIMLTLFSNIYYHLSFTIIKTVELGALNYSVNRYMRSLVLKISSFIFNLSIRHPIKLTLLSSILFFILLFILLLNNIINYI